MLNTLALSAYGGWSMRCECGTEHAISTREILFGSGTAQKLPDLIKRLAPVGAKILLVPDKKGMPIYQKTKQTLTHQGYRLTTQENQPQATTKQPPQSSLEDVKLVIALGGEEASNKAKLIAQKKGIELVILANSPSCSTYLTPYVLTGKNIPTPIKTPTPAALIADTDWLTPNPNTATTEAFEDKTKSDFEDETAADFEDETTPDFEDETAAGFGELASKLITLFDAQASALIAGTRACPYLLEQTQALIDSAIEKLETPPTNPKKTAALILEHNIRLSALQQCITTNHPHQIGETRHANYTGSVHHTSNMQMGKLGLTNDIDQPTNPHQIGETSNPHIGQPTNPHHIGEMGYANYTGSVHRTITPHTTSPHTTNPHDMGRDFFGGWMLGGGEVFAGFGLELLLCFGRRERRQRGENRFLIACVLAKIYASFLEKMTGFGFVPPPDDNLRAETAQRFFGIEEGAIMDGITRTNPAKQRIFDHRLSEFKQDLLAIIQSYDKKLTHCKKIYRRLLPDCGYSLKTYLTPTDLALSIALAPDLTKNFTLLTQMKTTGILDKLIPQTI